MYLATVKLRLYMLVAFLIIWWLLALLFPPLGWRYWRNRPVSELQQPQVHKLVSAPFSQKERLVHSIWEYRTHPGSEVSPTPWSAPGKESISGSNGDRGRQAWLS